MPADVTRDELDALAQEVEGEKMVTRHILEQTRRNGDDLAGIKTRLNRVEEKVDSVDRKVDGVGRQLEDLTKNLPKMVADVVRKVYGEASRKR